MNYLSVCSGVEAASVAWHELGWKPVGFSEIEKFPSAVLQHHYPQVTNFGDMTKYKEWNINESVGLLVGGTPCQSFSVAGLRKGLEDPRGNLALTYVGILDRFRPKWFIWENVPGVLSSNRGRDFGSFLGAVAECGYGFAYRVLDAQYFGVPQRRRRVFVVGCLGDWESAAKVLFESDCLSRNNPPSREKGERITSYIERGVAYGGTNGECSDTVTSKWHKGSGGPSGDECGLYVAHKVYETHPADSRVKEMGVVCQTVTSRWGTGGGNVPLVQTAFRKSRRAQSVNDHETWTNDGVANTMNLFDQGDIRTTHAVVSSYAIRTANTNANGHGVAEEVTHTLDQTQGQAIAYSLREDAKANNFSATPLHVTPALQALRPSVQSHHAQTFVVDRPIGALCARDYKGVGNQYVAEGKCIVESSMAVRRLTPVECERLQGFPDIKNSVTINVWSTESQKNSADAEKKSLKSLILAGIAERKDSQENASSVGMDFFLNYQQTSKPAALTVQLNLEQKNLAILSQEKLPLYVNTAKEQKWFHQAMQQDDFVQLVANLNTLLEIETRLGKVELQHIDNNFFHHLNGNEYVNLCGQEIKDLANDAGKFTQKMKECLKFITLEAGLNSQILDTHYQTLCSCVLVAINGFIQDKIQTETLFSIRLEITKGYTNIPWGKGDTPDSHRYKAMGNSMAVPCMKWIGKRIQEVENGLL